MESDQLIETIAQGITKNAPTVKTVYGDPIVSGEKTIIPVARIAYGFGGGFGQAPKQKMNRPNEMTTTEVKPTGEGAGGGGGMYSKAKGVYEITPTSTRFIPADAMKQFLLGITVGFIIKSLFFSKKKPPKSL